MYNDEPKLALLSLPFLAILEVISNMEIRDLFVLSLLSKRTKKWTRSLNLSPDSVRVAVQLDVTIVLQFDNLPLFGIGLYTRDYESSMLEMPTSVLVYGYRGAQVQTSPVSGVWKDTKGWMRHLQFIFNYKPEEKLFIGNGAFNFDIESIGRTFKELPEVTMINTRSMDYNESIFRELNAIKKLTVSSEVFEDVEHLEDVFIRNFDSLTIVFNDLFPRLTLNELLLINCKSIYLRDRVFPRKSLNRFLKMWINGSNPRMETCSFLFEVEDEMNQVLNGIKHKETQERRTFKSVNGEIEVNEGWEIESRNRLKATIQLSPNQRNNAIEMNMFVWHVCCI